jgi:hypothetical protein
MAGMVLVRFASPVQVESELLGRLEEEGEDECFPSFDSGGVVTC